jgi:hypothetical protein
MKEDNIKKLIDFTLEVTNGCNYNCTGCSIDKDGNSWPSDDEFNRIFHLVDDLSKSEFRPMNLQIGPTDIMTSVNRDLVLTSSKIKNLSKKFLKTSINCAFLDPFNENYIKLGQQLNWLLHGGLVKFVVPFEAYHIDNEEYVNRIRRRIELTLKNMPNVTHTKTYLLINYETSSIYDKENNTNITEELLLKTYKRSPILDGLHTDIILPHTRTDLRQEKNRKNFYDAVMKLREYITRARKKYGKDIEVSELRPHEGKDWDIFYKAGKLYMTPFLLEGLASFDEAFEVKDPWTFEGLYNSYFSSFLEQLDWASNNDACRECQLIPDCAERGIHTLMKISKINECISPAKKLEDNIVWY